MDYQLDITKEKCPMTFVKVKLKLASMQPGEKLDVLLKEGEPLVNVPKSAEEQGYKVLAIQEMESPNHLVSIEK